MKRAVVSVTNNLTTDQRVHKICSTLLKMNFDVLIIGRKDNSKLETSTNFRVVKLKPFFNTGFLFYAEYNLRLFFKLLFTKKTILIANDLDTLLPNYLISIFQKKKLIYDSHELFTEVPELIDRKFVQNFWLKLESFIIPKLKNCITVSYSISEYYKNKYHTNFVTVRNFPLKTTSKLTVKFPFKTNHQNIVLYQGALNKGRGLELIIETMQYLENTFFVIIGSGDIEQKLQQKVIDLGLEHSIKFVPKITPNKLKKITPLANLGISLEEDLGLNYRYALPNKLFDYIQAQVPVLVSDLIEMRQIIETYAVGEIVTNRNPEILAKQIKNMLEKGKTYYKNNLEKAANELIWENESKKIIELFNNLK